MLSRGKMRAEHYSMLGKTGRAYSNRSVLSSDTGVRDRVLEAGNFSPHNQSILAKVSQKSRRQRQRHDSVSQS